MKISIKASSIDKIFNKIMHSFEWDGLLGDNMRFKQWFEETNNCTISYTLGISWNHETITFESEEDYFLFLMEWS